MYDASPSEDAVMATYRGPLRMPEPVEPKPGDAGPKPGDVGPKPGDVRPKPDDVGPKPDDVGTPPRDAPPHRLLEREKGFEPSTSTLARWHSTTELLPQRSRSISVQ